MTRYGKDLRPFIGADWWGISITKYSVNGEADRTHRGKGYYILRFPPPTSDTTCRVMIGIIGAAVIILYTVALGI